MEKRTTAGAAALGASGDLVTGGFYESCFDGTEWVLQATSSTPYTGGALTSGQMIRGNFANQVQGSSGIISTNGTSLTTYNSETTAGTGITYIRGVTSQKSETGADSSVLTVTPNAVAGTYRIQFVMSVSAASAATLGWSASWTDSNGNAQAPTNLALFQSGTAAPALTFTTSTTGTYFGYADVDVNNASAPIVVKLTFSGTSFTAKVTATVERLI
ncbi:MAG TPA: hypothetical protein VGS27_28225 [Candidatus Sulfotelmatobacter sp.]|nr:hypothetical protein [Candidatus Sulfotelmatobacter sp.]